MRFSCAVGLVLAFAAPALGQWTTLDSVTAVRQIPNGATVTLKSGGTLKLEACTDRIVHVTYSPTANFPASKQYVVTKAEWTPVQAKVEDSEKQATISTAALKIVVGKEDGGITFSAPGAVPANDHLFRDGKRIMTPVTVNGEKTYRAETVVEMYGTREGFYGLGQHQAGVWNYHGASIDLSQENTEIAVPMLLSSNGYGIFWNNTSRTRVNDRFVHAMYISSEVADTIDYYFIYGPEFDKIIAGYRELTGQVPMFGRWAYGFWQCKNRYRSQEEILAVAQKYRDLHIPVDNIVQDWFWWNRKGEHVFNKNYPDPKGMVDQLHKNNFHLMISVWPFFEP